MSRDKSTGLHREKCSRLCFVSWDFVYAHLPLPMCCASTGEKQYMSFLRKTLRLARAAKVESLVPTPATPVNRAAGDSLFL
jgi:hypothetical protein